MLDKKKTYRGLILTLLLFLALTASAVSFKLPELPPGKSEKQLTSILEAIITDLVQKDKFSGAVLVAKNGKPFYTRAVGEASKRYRVPNKIDTKFNLGSMNKMFTGVAIVQLAQQNKLLFDDLVGKHLPDYPNKEVREKVTIHHLLTHTSGMGLYWIELFHKHDWILIKTAQDYDALANKKPLSFEPGERFQYSNCGPIVLGLIIEKISGLSYDEYIQMYVTGPAGMENTYCYDITTPVPNLATGYTKRNLLGEPQKNWLENYFVTPSKGGPAGGGYSTVEDLLRFDIALRSYQLLDQEHFAILTTGKVDRTPDKKYAYLFEEQYINGHRVIGHGGGAAGINSQLRMYMDLGYTVVIMSNYDPPAAGIVVNELAELLTGD